MFLTNAKVSKIQDDIKMALSMRMLKDPEIPIYKCDGCGELRTNDGMVDENACIICRVYGIL